MAPKQPGLESSRLCCLGRPSTDGISSSTMFDYNMDQLKQAIVTHRVERFIDRAIGQWRRRLECIVQQQGALDTLNILCEEIHPCRPTVTVKIIALLLSILTVIFELV